MQSIKLACAATLTLSFSYAAPPFTYHSVRSSGPEARPKRPVIVAMSFTLKDVCDEAFATPNALKPGSNVAGMGARRVSLQVREGPIALDAPDDVRAGRLPVPAERDAAEWAEAATGSTIIPR